jgi:large subunit ribosomal protein L7/L12
MSEKQEVKEISEIIEKIEVLNLGQVSELIEQIKEKYNIQETALVQATGDTQSSEKVEEKTVNVSLKLLDVGSQKIIVYKIIMEKIKELKGKEINIVEVQKLTKEEGGIILENVPKEKAEEVKKQLEEKGAKVEIK